MRVVCDGPGGAGLWTAGTVHGGPRPSLPLLSVVHGASSGLGTMAPPSLCLTATLLTGGELAHSRAVVARRGY
jgi:hypothetical protein